MSAGCVKSLCYNTQRMKRAKGVYLALRIGLESARMNLVPMISLWILAAVLVLLYYFAPGFAAVLDPIRDWQDAWGWRAAFVNGLVFCGLLPGVFLFAVRALRVRRLALTVFAQSVWAGLCGVVVLRGNGGGIFIGGTSGAGRPLGPEAHEGIRLENNEIIRR